MAHEISDDCSNVIAVDGPAASGKGTLARRLAAHFGYAHLDTGKLYRAVALVLLDADTDPADEVRAALAAASLGAADIEGATLADPALAREDVGRAASLVAAQPSVRAALFDLQRNFAAHPPGGAAGAVLDGRDIGTVICPEARVKFFITASLEARAERRHKELLERGEARIHAQILADLAARDRRDGSREIAPTRAAEDAIEIDTTSMGADAVFAAALGAIKAP
ncbi:MAG: (d)CMP kinase [Alphaproteobacteria bacterium]|nr:(d)CMP kinase [Alphaproteobacteria bacterium]